MTFASVKLTHRIALLGMLCIVTPIRAQSPAADQTASVTTITAPAPPPPSVETKFVGPLSFLDGYPTQETVRRLSDELDFQRATQVFLRNLPALDMVALRTGMARDLGVDGSSKLAIFRATANSLLLTANPDALYAMTFLALDTDGPTVVEVPPGVLGFVNDMWMRPIEDFGDSGRDHGRGGKYLLVPVGYTGSIPERGYFIACMHGNGGWFAVSATIAPPNNDTQAQDLLKQIRIYPFAKRFAAASMTYVEATGKAFDTTPPNDIRAFEMLSDLMANENELAIDPEISGMLKAVGIEKGKPFSPDARMKEILAEAAQVGSFMSQAVSSAHSNSERVREGSNWMAGIPGYLSFSDGRSTLMDEVIAKSWFTTGVSKALARPQPGMGAQYAWTYRDATGTWLLGEKTYRLHIPPNAPAQDFWSLLIYDNWSRAILANGQEAGKSSRDRNLQANSDGSIDIYFGPHPPRDEKNNWIRTVPGKGWFAMLRLYRPTQPWFDRTWIPNDIVQAGEP